MMRTLFIYLLLGTSLNSFSQDSIIQSATSAWVKVNIKASSHRKVTSSIPIAFRETFDTNTRFWREGLHGDYTYTIADNTYSIQRNRVDSKRTAFSFIQLPEDINLNRTDTFTVQVEIVGKPGIVPEGGLLLGILDSLNYCQVRITDQRQVVVSMVLDGKVANRYFPGGASPPQRSVQLERNTLTVRRKDQKLFIYINKQEISSSPFVFRSFRGNGLGIVTSGEAISFRNLTIRARPTPLPTVAHRPPIRGTLDSRVLGKR